MRTTTIDIPPLDDVFIELDPENIGSWSCAQCGQSFTLGEGPALRRRNVTGYFCTLCVDKFPGHVIAALNKARQDFASPLPPQTQPSPEAPGPARRSVLNRIASACRLR
jgi:hypothetical protein